MKITVDTETGAINVSGSYTIGELLHALEYFHPDFEWRDLECSTALYLYVPEEPIPTTPPVPAIPLTKYQKRRKRS